MAHNGVVAVGGRLTGYGYLLTHYVISALICKAATEAGIDPDRVKFKRAVRIVRLRRAADLSPLNSRNASSQRSSADIARTKHLNPRCRYRTYPKSSNEPATTPTSVKRPGERGTRHDGPAMIAVVNLHPNRLAALINLG